ncbi:hypothetical protein AN963_08785 [Brevibacillus choshinensis]|uniref:Uncharacterized protein n=1 Tax=Brevibacillus choshinensis TaxID=54911 RepID=A0ABR5NE09_BRECH|nr:Ger(x)C family spore germination protein [Brevibacillus choshinensis]KQL49788.1 hypothetical protein AN963_08785 [Brevibacillus choshinensis]
MITKDHVHYLLKVLLMAGYLIVSSGCSINKDINHRALPIVMGLENGDGGYKIYLLIPNMNQSRTNVRIVTGTGKTINEILDRISKNMEIQVDLLHLKVIVFERALAEKGLGDSISSFMRARDISSKTIMAISEERLGPLFDKLKSSSTQNGMDVYNFFEKNAGWSPDVALTRIWQVFRSLHSYTNDVAIPMIKPGQTTAIASTGSAVIRNGKMVGKITSDETLLVNTFIGLGTQGKIEVMDHASVRILAEKISHSSSVVGNQVILNSNLKLKITILETKGAASVTMIKQELEALLTGRFQRLFRKTQSVKADILGVGQLFRAKIPRDRLEHWRSDYYPNMKMTIQINTIVQNEGLLKTKS